MRLYHNDNRFNSPGRYNYYKFPNTESKTDKFKWGRQIHSHSVRFFSDISFSSGLKNKLKSKDIENLNNIITTLDLVNIYRAPTQHLWNISSINTHMEQFF